MFRLFKRKPKDQAPISKYKVTASKDQVSVTPVNYISPFRSMNDFISNDVNAWNIPDFSDTARLKNRIINNLIYYQTNYCVLGIQLMLLVGASQLKDLFTSFFVMVVFLVAFTCISSLFTGSGSTPFHLYPEYVKAALMISFFVTLCGVIDMGVHFIRSFLDFICSLPVPILVILAHAALRKRNFSNKVVNMLEKVKLSKTPMGTFLEAMRSRN